MVYRDDRRYISQLFKVESAVVEAIEDEIADCSIDWHEPYPEYATPGLKVAVLSSPDGVDTNFSWGTKAKPVATPLLESLPATMEFIDGLGFHIVSARLLRLDQGAFVYEHSDKKNEYSHYSPGSGRLRLHFPVATTSDAALVLPGRAVHLKKGFLWKLNPTKAVHGSFNFGSVPRLHLIFDCLLNERLARFIENEFLDHDCQIELSPLALPEKVSLMEAAGSAAREGRLLEAEHIILSAFCKYNLSNLTSYDLLMEFIGKTPVLAHRMQFWQDRYAEAYPTRFVAPVLAVV
ncbi:MAG: aspartyl/asparaginyl beta-hydroxylase domain-containing protein [Candidatus Obscuribacterales bacterium]|nr:aspartyl/asparaginyl beta-hydroxylase domain-containing protein [Candidatus Obscuribacterales bacterium]